MITCDALQNTQNDCFQWLFNSSRVHQIRFRLGLCPEPHWGCSQHSPNSPSWFKGPTSKERGGKGGEVGEEVGEGQKMGEWKGRGKDARGRGGEEGRRGGGGRGKKEK